MTNSISEIDIVKKLASDCLSSLMNCINILKDNGYKDKDIRIVTANALSAIILEAAHYTCDVELISNYINVIYIDAQRANKEMI